MHDPRPRLAALHVVDEISRAGEGIHWNRHRADFRRAEKCRDEFSRIGQDNQHAIAARHSKLEKRSEEHTSELQSPCNLVCRLLLEKKKLKQDGAIFDRSWSTPWLRCPGR